MASEQDSCAISKFMGAAYGTSTIVVLFMASLELSPLSV